MYVYVCLMLFECRFDNYNCYSVIYIIYFEFELILIRLYLGRN